MNNIEYMKSENDNTRQTNENQFTQKHQDQSLQNDVCFCVDDYKTMFDTSVDIMLIASEDTTILKVNKRFCEILEYDISEVEGKSYHKFIHPFDVSPTIDIENHLLGDEIENRVINFSNRYLKKSGTYIALTWKAIFIKSAKKYYGTASDNRNSDIFLSKASHELRTPLNSIMGYLQLIAINNKLSIDDKSSVDEALKSSTYLLSMINDLLEMSKINIYSAMSDVSIYQTICACISQQKNEILKKNITLRFDTRRAENYIYATESKVVQIFNNLLSNAIKYNKNNGNINISCDIQDDEIIIIIEDTGIGIAEENIVKLYNPFERLNIDTNKYEGNGLGLSIAYKIIQLYKGRIVCESKLGEWTRFTVCLPLSPDVSTTLNSKMENIIIGNVAASLHKKILYIEDNMSNINLVKNIVRAKYTNLRLDVAVNGKDGIKMIEENEYDLYLVDWALPDINGDEIIRSELGNNRIKDSQKIILTTAFVDRMLVQKLEKMGVTKFLFKPINITEFYEHIERNIDSLIHVKRT